MKNNQNLCQVVPVNATGRLTSDIETLILNPSKIGLTQIMKCGDDMKGVIDGGDIMFIRPINKVGFVHYGDIYLIEVNNYKIVRWIHPGPTKDTWLLKSSNPWFQDDEIQIEHIEKLWLVARLNALKKGIG